MTEKQLEELIAQIETAKAAVVELGQIMDDCETANSKYLARIDHLECLYWKMWGENEKLRKLCNDLFDHVCAEQIGARVNMQQFVELSDRMDELGLLEDCHEQTNGNL